MDRYITFFLYFYIKKQNIYRRTYRIKYKQNLLSFSCRESFFKFHFNGKSMAIIFQTKCKTPFPTFDNKRNKFSILFINVISCNISAIK